MRSLISISDGEEAVLSTQSSVWCGRKQILLLMDAAHRNKDSTFYMHPPPCYLHMRMSSSDQYVDHEIDGSMTCKRNRLTK